jgi:hypothetical protein
MKYCETLYINCENNGQIAELHNSHVIRMDNTNFHAYAQFICFLGRVFFTAARLSQDGILKKPYNVSFIVPKIKKFKEEDAETNLVRLKYIANNFIPPEYGLVISIYAHQESFAAPVVPENKLGTPHDSFIMWPYKRQWNTKNTKNYIAINDISCLIKNRNYDNEKYKKILDTIINQLEISGTKYKFVDYTMPIKEVFNRLLSCKTFLSWSGGCYHIAGGLNVPTVGFGHGPYTQMNNYIYNRPAGRPLRKPILKTVWGESYNHQGKVIHYDEFKGVFESEQSHVINNIGTLEKKEELDFLRLLWSRDWNYNWN